MVLLGSLAIGVWVAAEPPDSTPSFDDVQQQRGSVNGLVGVRKTVYKRGNTTSESVERVWLRPGTGQYRIEDIHDDPQWPERKVANGSSLWLYDDDAQTAIQIDISQTDRSSSGDRIARLLAVVRAADGPVTAGSVDPLPVVPVASERDGTTRGIAGQITVAYTGTATVAGRDTYVLSLRSTANAAGVVSNFSQTVWLDQEWYVPLKRTTEYHRDGTPVKITVSYENVTFNPGLSDERFQFDLPPNGTVKTNETPTQQQFVDIAQLQAVANYSVPEPILPDSFDLRETTRTVGNVRSIGLRYANETATVAVSKSNLTWYQPHTEGRNVSIGSETATLRNIGTELRISWTCADARYSVAGTGLSADPLIEIARSVACR
ncbi:outer membrane lipoprotein carrier protein LolA [Halorhabdus salina]|uniref:outer membrane lipoprotein carrier protein LolA n=1 Tax=Halorhabdus salina TaxID=2750670 RepID=UPI0028683A57|nr:outer membrane lipoprotein carrier protein LolA [Halorhabdus salina]